MTQKRPPITGGCLCGAVRYESTESPVNGGYCHCRMCQKASGGLFTAWVDEKVSWHVIADDMPQFASNFPEIPQGQGGTS